LIERTELFKRFLHDMNQVISFEYEQNVRMEVRIHNLSFFVPYDHHQNQQENIHTVWNQTLLYHSLQFFRRLRSSNSTTDSFHNMDEERTLSQYTMEMLGLAHVADTFVGDSNVRGISGGQRRRVTVGEVLKEH
jgi:ABC-type multidrug transport system ATPase subunit